MASCPSLTVNTLARTTKMTATSPSNIYSSRFCISVTPRARAGSSAGVTWISGSRAGATVIVSLGIGDGLRSRRDQFIERQVHHAVAGLGIDDDLARILVDIFHGLEIHALARDGGRVFVLAQDLIEARGFALRQGQHLQAIGLGIEQILGGLRRARAAPHRCDRFPLPADSAGGPCPP